MVEPKKPRARGKPSTCSSASFASSATTKTLLVQSGKAVGRFRTHPDAPRILIANSNLVPNGHLDDFRRLEALGLTMFGQMTAGSWIYIGSQGILQGTYETFVAARKAYAHRAKSRRAPWVLTAGLGGMGGAQPLAATMAGISCLASKSIRRASASVSRRITSTFASTIWTAALARIEAAQESGQPVSIGLCGNAAEVYPELARRGVVPPLVTEQTSAHESAERVHPRPAFP